MRTFLNYTFGFTLLFVLVGSFFYFYHSLQAAGWYDTNYTYCRKLTMTAGGDSGGVATTTTNGFALVATSTISSLAATTTVGGRIQKISEWNNAASTTPIDVAITNGTDCNSDGGTLLDFYFEKYATSTGAFTLWVEAADISSTTAKTVLMYYGNASASDVSDKPGTFGALNEVAVWNLNEDPSITAPQMRDATSNANNGTSGGTMTTSDQVTGQVDGAVNFDGADDYVNAQSGASIDNIFADGGTIIAWIQPSGWGEGGFGRIIEKSDVGVNGLGWIWFLNDTDGAGDTMRLNYYTNGATTNAGAWNSAGNSIVLNQWQQAVMIMNSNTLTNDPVFYVDGVLSATTERVAPPDTAFDSDATQSLYIGNSSAQTRTFTGDIDDVRYFDRILHAMDIKTIYNNTSSSALFWTFGAEETQTAQSFSEISRVVLPSGSLKIQGGSLKLY